MVSIVPGTPVNSSVRWYAPSAPSCHGPPVVRKHHLDQRAIFLGLQILNRTMASTGDPGCVHEVRRTDVPLRPPSVGEAEDARMLEILADDRTNLILLLAQAGPERADAAVRRSPGRQPGRCVEARRRPDRRGSCLRMIRAVSGAGVVVSRSIMASTQCGRFIGARSGARKSGWVKGRQDVEESLTSAPIPAGREQASPCTDGRCRIVVGRCRCGLAGAALSPRGEPTRLVLECVLRRPAVDDVGPACSLAGPLDVCLLVKRALSPPRPRPACRAPGGDEIATMGRVAAGRYRSS